MRWTDDDLSALMRSADPAATPPDASPTPVDVARLQRIMAPEAATAGTASASWWRPSARLTRPGRVAMRFAWALPAIAAIAAVGFAIAPLTATPAYAVTPPVLAVERLPQTVDQVLASSISRLDAAANQEARRDAEVVRWALRTDGKDTPVIVPEWQHWVWNPDGTGQLKATAGASYSVTSDGRIVDPAGEAPPEGTSIETRQQAERYGFFRDRPPSDPVALHAYLAERTGLASDADGLAIWGAVSALRDEWSLSPAQQGAALELLRDAGGVSLLGTVTDRFSRAGIALRVSSVDRPQFSATVVLDTTSREIIAADIVYLGGNTLLDLPPNSVIGYSVWLSR
ncbi:hypothetical protein QF046_001196 [Microbacterium sp. W4I4]|uniref:hypothetical protein n=1 Tax=Microbacterium sp. W4I4 TaxID=3042295 RepID=UPI00277ED87C|nr:hypothetical protein [Microbacterium sp. W4I4]MDQ0613555.1 hypothetical protein [Microbacterium sp. W4I4]